MDDKELSEKFSIMLESKTPEELKELALNAKPTALGGHISNEMSNVEASRLALEQMMAMSVDETLERMAECRGSDTALAFEQLIQFGASE